MPEYHDAIDSELFTIIDVATQEVKASDDILAAKLEIFDRVLPTFGSHCSDIINTDESWRKLCWKIGQELHETEASTDHVGILASAKTFEIFLQQWGLQRFVCEQIYTIEHLEAGGPDSKKVSMAMVSLYDLDQGVEYPNPEAHWSNVVDEVLPGEPLRLNTPDDKAFLSNLSSLLFENDLPSIFTFLFRVLKRDLSPDDYTVNAENTFCRMTAILECVVSIQPMPTLNVEVASNHALLQQLAGDIGFSKQEVDNIISEAGWLRYLAEG
jgi:hypothetical protein